MNQSLVKQQNSSYSILKPTTFEEAMKMADIISKSGMVPKDYINRPGAVLVAMQMGSELGLQPMQAIQNISVINGRPSMWGDSLLAVVRGFDKCESIREIYDDERQIATCIAKRKNEKHEVIRTFSMADAQVAGLAGKQGPWKQYPKRMCQMRARAFALRDAFPDALRGIATAEEVFDEDIIPTNGSSKVSDLTARLATPVDVEQQREPVNQEKTIQQDSDIKQLQGITESIKQSLNEDEVYSRPESKVEQIKQIVAPVPVSDKDKFAFEMVIEAIRSSKNKGELQEIANDARNLHPDLQVQARKEYQNRVNEFHQN